MNTGTNILYYYTNIFIVLMFMIVSFILIKPINKNITLYNNYNDKNIIEISEIGNTKINFKNNNNYETSTLKLNNNGTNSANYNLKYRIYDTNINHDDIILLINDIEYKYSDIVSVNNNNEYVDLNIDSDNININDEKIIEFAFVIDSNDRNIYINGSYVIDSINSLVVFK